MPRLISAEIRQRLIDTADDQDISVEELLDEFLTGGNTPTSSQRQPGCIESCYPGVAPGPEAVAISKRQGFVPSGFPTIDVYHHGRGCPVDPKQPMRPGCLRDCEERLMPYNDPNGNPVSRECHVLECPNGDD